jgi:hypothetical protein
MSRSQSSLFWSCIFLFFVFAGEPSIWSIAQRAVANQLSRSPAKEITEVIEAKITAEEEPALIQFEYRHRKTGAVLWESNDDNVPAAYRPTGMQRSLYTSPQPHEFVDLTPEEEQDIMFHPHIDNAYDRMRYTVQLLKEKNQ